MIVGNIAISEIEKNDHIFQVQLISRHGINLYIIFTSQQKI